MKSYPTLITRDIVPIPYRTVRIEAGRDRSIAVANYYNKDPKKNNKIVIATQIDSLIEVPSLKDIYKIGALCEIVNVEPYSGANQEVYYVEVMPLKRVEILDLLTDKEYYEAKVEPAKETGASSPLNKKLIEELETVVRETKQKINFTIKADEENASKTADLIGGAFSEDDLQRNKLNRHAILSELNITRRLRLVIRNLRLNSLGDEVKRDIDQTINKKVNDNLSNQQKEFYLREKIRAVKDELGKLNPNENDLSGFKKKLEENPYPDNIRIKVTAEIQKIETNGFSQENAISKSYIEWLLNLPYWQTTEDDNNIKHVKNILDRSHYGLEKVKERIIEYLAVRARAPKGKSPIICLVGPPGVGKTSLAKSIAEALNKKFIKVSLGGVHDESEIRGHRRTYLGSMPGRIIKGMKQVGVTNPLFLLDEIDKMSVDGYHGDPSNALLEVLDPEQNTMFSDNYIEENYDLSNVLFLATANYIEQIPAPLQDRLEIIELTSYTEKEKLSIAENYLIEKVLTATNLSPEQLKFEKPALLYIIRHYTREAGVRELERQISKIARKLAVKLQYDKEIKLSVTDAVVREYLGKILYDYNSKDDQPLPGVVNGMAYTTAGGDLLPIEVTYFPGKGNISITGNLKETMKESAQVALGYVRANAQVFGINSDFDFSKFDIHIHVPSGGIPKDGPSAGVTLTTAIISAITKRVVPNTLAMTGEITLRGKVGIIGGVREKIISAFRGGVNEFFIPKDDERFIDEVPEEVKEKITIHFVENYLEIYQSIFEGKVHTNNFPKKSMS